MGMSKVLYKGKNYDIVKYNDFTIEQKNGVRIITFNNYTKAKEYLDKIDK